MGFLSFKCNRGIILVLLSLLHAGYCNKARHSSRNLELQIKENYLES